MPETMPNPLKPPQNDDAVAAWLQDQMRAGLRYLLAHADDGVIWGKLVDGKLVTSRDVADEQSSELSPPLRGITLQQAFVFGPTGEVRLWRDGAAWQCYQCDETDERAFADHFDELQVLWGTDVVRENTQYGFTHIREARQQGLDQIVPLVVNKQMLGERRLRLQVRHFIERDPDTGEARIAFSRLVDVTITN